MRALQKTAAGVLAVALIATIYGIWAMYQSLSFELSWQEFAVWPVGGDAVVVIDERILCRAYRLASLASTSEEVFYV